MVAEEVLLALCMPGLEVRDVWPDRRPPLASSKEKHGRGTTKLICSARLCPY